MSRNKKQRQRRRSKRLSDIFSRRTSKTNSQQTRRIGFEPLEDRRLLAGDLIDGAGDGRSGRIIINDTAGNATAIALGDQHPNVVDTPGCSGTLIDMTHVATAQHCVFGGGQIGQTEVDPMRWAQNGVV